MAEIAAGLNGTQYGISSYIGGTATPYQQATINIGLTGVPTDTFSGITATEVAPNKYTTPPFVNLWANPLPGKYVYMIGLRGNGLGNMVYARIEIQAKMQFRQTCYNGWREGYWVKYFIDPPQYIWVYTRTKSGTSKYQEQVYDWYPVYTNYYQVTQPASVRFRATANYQIMTVTNNSFITPGSLFAGGNAKVSRGSFDNGVPFDNKDGVYSPFGQYTFSTSTILGGTNYALRGPTGAIVVQWDEKDKSFPWDDNSTQVYIGVGSDTAAGNATIDNWNVKDTI